MSRKIKLAPIHLDTFNQQRYNYPQQEPIEILAPVSFELSSSKQTNMGTGVLGNAIAGRSFYKERSYNFNWVGTKAEIDKIKFYIHQTSEEFFMFGGLTDNPIVTPTVMFNSKAMLASLIDQYKPVSSRYENFLPNYWLSSAPRRGSTGVRLANRNATIDNQFGVLPYWAEGATAYVYLEKGKSYSWIYDPYFMNAVGDNPHYTPLEFTVVSLASGGNGGVIHHSVNYTTFGNAIFDLVDNLQHDAILQIKVARPTPDITANFDNPTLFGVLNYAAPLITTSDVTSTQDGLIKASLNSYGEVPSLVTPVDEGMYNVLSPSLAEFSCTFSEVVNVIS